MLSEKTLLRTWSLPPLRVEGSGNSLVADFGVATDDTMASAIRLPGGTQRGGLSWVRAEGIAKETIGLHVGYAYFAADLSAADEPIFDPTSSVCLREVNPRIFSGYSRQYF